MNLRRNRRKGDKGFGFAEYVQTGFFTRFCKKRDLGFPHTRKTNLGDVNNLGDVMRLEGVCKKADISNAEITSLLRLVISAL